MQAPALVQIIGVVEAQVILLPPGFELDCAEVAIERTEDGVRLRPLPRHLTGPGSAPMDLS